MSDQTQYPTPTAHTLASYNEATEDQKEVMRYLFGPDAFRPKSPFDVIKTVEHAGDYLGMKPYYMRDVKEDDDYEDNPKEWNKAMYYFDALCVARALNRIANGGKDWEWNPKEEDTWAYQIFCGVRMPIEIEGVKMVRPGSLRFVTEEAAQYFIDTFPELITALK